MSAKQRKKKSGNSAASQQNWTIVVDSAGVVSGSSPSQQTQSLGGVSPKNKSSRFMIGGGGAATLRAALRSGTPGGWSSNHRAEAEHFVGWDYVAIRAIALQFAQASCNAYQDQDSKKAQIRRSMLKSCRNNPVERARVKAAYNMAEDDSILMDTDSPLVRLLSRPNKREGGGVFRFKIAMQLNLTGSCLVWNVPNQAGLTVERWIIPTSAAQPMMPNPEFPAGYYLITPEISRWYDNSAEVMNGVPGLFAGAEIDARQIQAYRWPHAILLDDGQSPIGATALWSDTSLMIDRRRHSHMSKGANPSVAVSYGTDENGNPVGPEDEDQLERLEERFSKKYSGPENDGAAMFLTGGASIEKLSHTAVEMDYVKSFEQIRNAKLAAHGTPPIAVGIESPTGRDGLYAPLAQWVFLTIQPQLDIIAEQDTIELAPQFGQNITIEYTAIKIDDSAPSEEQLKTDISAGTVEVNEVREMRGRKPWGDERGKAIAGLGVQQQQQTQQSQPGQDGFSGAMQQQGQPGAMQLDTQQQSQQPTPQPGSTLAGVNAETTLNGAQIDGALKLLASVQDGSLSHIAAIELLVAIGIPRARAAVMVGEQKKIEKPLGDAMSGNENGNGNGGGSNGSSNGNGHSSGNGSSNGNSSGIPANGKSRFRFGGRLKNCGTGDGGFQAGNTCADGGDGPDGGSGESDSGSGSVNPKILSWAQEKFGDEVAENGKTKAENFAEWFGDSKVVDENGGPLVVYHGAKSNFEEFDSGKFSGGSFGDGFYFTDDTELATQYARSGVLIESHLSLKNPYVINRDDMDYSEYLEAQKPFKQKGARERLIEMGFDGVVYREDGYSEIVAFSPNQIKSATSNNGNFNPKENSIKKTHFKNYP